MIKMLSFFLFLCSSTDYFVKWNGDNRTICHQMWPCNWSIAVNMFKRGDIIRLADAFLSTKEQLHAFQNLTEYVLNVGGEVSANNCTIDGTNFSSEERDFFLQVSPFNESAIFGFSFRNFHCPVISLRGMDMFLVMNCSFINNSVAYDYPIFTLTNITVICENTLIANNTVDSTSVVGLSTAILALYESVVENNVQKSKGPIPLFELTNGASILQNTSVRNNVCPGSPLFASWFYIIFVVNNTVIMNNNYDDSSMIVGDSIANVNITNSTVKENRGALLHSMTMSSLFLEETIFKDNNSTNQALIYAPRSKVEFLNHTVVANNIADSITSSQMSNESSLVVSDTILANNTCADTAFALSHGESKISNSTLASNIVKQHAFIDIQQSNFTIDGSIFDSNFAPDDGTLIKISDCSLHVNTSVFTGNSGGMSGAFEIAIENNESHSFIFRKTRFADNNGKNVSSVFFSKKLPPVRFEYCNFSRKRFDEVNGDLNKPQLFHRCRFIRQINEGFSFSFRFNSEEMPNANVFIISFTSYVITFVFLCVAYVLLQQQQQK